MSILWNVKKYFNNAVDTVKSVFTPSTITKSGDTLNEQINSWTIWTKMPARTAGSFADLLNNQNNLSQNSSQSIIQPTEPAQMENILSGAGTVQNDILGLQKKQDVVADEKKKWWFHMPDFVWFGEKLVGDVAEIFWDVADFAEERHDLTNRELQRNKDYRENQKVVSLHYEPDSNTIQYLSTTDNEKFNTLLEMASYQLNDAQTPAERQAIIEKFCDDTRDLFEILPSTQYASKYDEDTLNKLSQNKIFDNPNQKYGKYTPTNEEILTYIDTQVENSNLYQNLTNKYITTDRDRLILNLWNDETSNTISNFTNLAEEWIHDKIQSIIWTKDWWEAADATLYYRDAVSDQINRIMPFMESIFRYEKEALSKPASERNEWDLYIIETAAIARRALDKYALNLNNWMTHILNEWVNSKWEIIDALDNFEWNLSLNDILTDWLQNIMWLELRMWKHVSPIDMFQELANDWIYKYKQANTNNLIKKWWYWLERVGERSWDWFGEVWQAMATVPVSVANLVTWNWWKTQSAAYFDNDFSIGKLIETDDSQIKRTLKKYALQFWEYAPEWLANVLPDIAMIAYNAPGWLVKATTNIWRFWKRINSFKNIDRLRKLSSWLDKTLKWIEKIWAVWQQWANINSKNRRVWNIIDRWLTQFAIWQWMDAKLSVFDTEPYSDTSFWISAIWSLAWDILPEVKDLYWIFRTWIKWGKWALNSWVWDLVDFISQSEDNANAIARAMWKKYPQFTEQELRDFVKSYAEISDAAKLVYDELSKEWKIAANSWTKDLMYNYVKQAYWANSNIWKSVRQIVINKNTSPADIMKYVWRIPWDVQFWPYTSVIRLKHWTTAWVSAKDGWWYDIKLDALDWWFDRRVYWWFTDEDISKISNIDWYDDIAKNKKEFFDKVWDNYFLKEEWLSRFWLNAKSLTLESLWVDISQAENTREILKEKMKNLSTKKVSDDTINMLADWWWYDEIVNKVKEILC